MIQKLQLAEQPPKPERVPAEQLTPGQFLAAGALTTGRPTEVLFVDTYPLDGGGRETLIVHRALGVDWPSASTVKGNRWFDLAAEADLARFRANVERAQKIADIRALADWLEDNPDVPMPNSYHAIAHLDERHIGGPTAAESYAEVRRVAARLGVDAEERLDDRTTVSKTFGSATYQVIAWHPDGRPAEPEIAEHYETSGWKGEGPGACGIECACGVTYDGFDSLAEAHQQLAWHIADPSGQDYGRADTAEVDDPTPVSGARVEPHTGGVLSGIAQDGHRLGEPGAPVDETEPVHMDLTTGESMCGLAATTPHRGALALADVTCPDCRATY